ncbi:MAG: outer membrane beta-barrel protein [Vicinamibacterales bacterium]
MATHRWGIPLVTLTFVLATGAVGEGQQAERESTGRWQAGILTVTPLIAVREIGVDTNLFNEAVDPKSDFTFIASPAAKASLGFPVGRLTFGSQVDLVYFQTYASERSVNTNTRLDFELPINRLRLRSAASYVNGRRRQNSEIDARVAGTEAAVVIGGAVKLSGVTALGFEIERTRVAFSEDQVFDGEHLQSRLNRDEDRFTTSLRYSVTPLTTLVVNGDLDRWRFELSPLRDANSVRLFPGVEFDASALLSGRAFVGYRRFDILDPDLPGFNGLVASGDLTYTIRESTRLSVIFDRDLTYSYRRVRPYYLLTSWTGSVRQKLGSSWEVEGRGGRERLDYSAASPAGTTILPPETVHHYGLRLNYTLGRDSRIHVDLVHRDRISPIERRNYEAIQASVSASYGF